MLLRWRKTPNYWVCRLNDTTEVLVEMDKEGYWCVDAGSFLSYYMDINKIFSRPDLAAKYVEKNLLKVKCTIEDFLIKKSATEDQT